MFASYPSQLQLSMELMLLLVFLSGEQSGVIAPPALCSKIGHQSSINFSGNPSLIQLVGQQHKYLQPCFKTKSSIIIVISYLSRKSMREHQMKIQHLRNKSTTNKHCNHTSKNCNKHTNIFEKHDQSFKHECKPQLQKGTHIKRQN